MSVELIFIRHGQGVPIPLFPTGCMSLIRR